MISDSCNSGTNYKNFRDMTEATPIQPFGPDVASQMKAQMIHFGGCRDGFGSGGYQTGGTFTMALCEVWNGGSFSGDYPKFHAAIKSKVTGQVVQYNEYGPVSATFRSQKPFSTSSGAVPAEAVAPDAAEDTGRLTSNAGGMLTGPRFGGDRGLEDWRVPLAA